MLEVLSVLNVLLEFGRKLQVWAEFRAPGGCGLICPPFLRSL